ncbi:MAG TPA: histidinol-phosphate transaminase [Steroidobacteraceae bacterium]|nr:histidinol-phosphate transaminase [Steroidobacteraceae bacterium]
MSWVNQLARPDIVALKAYEHAAWDPGLERLHANELPWRSIADDSQAGLNRYPEPQPRALVERLAGLYGVEPECVLVGRGSDEAIDLLTRGFCRAGTDAVLICPPTFGMYAVAARIQGAEVLQVPLRADREFTLDESAVLEQCGRNVKLVFLCSPNNPTGNLLTEEVVLRLAAAVAGRAIVVVDEAYIEFAAVSSLSRHIRQVPHLAILRTLSKAHALAGARCGTLLADREIIALLRKVIPPYALAQQATESVLRALEPSQLQISRSQVETIRRERQRLLADLPGLRDVRRVWPSQANFLLVAFADAGEALARARAARLLIRDVRGYAGLADCLRITVGTAEQNSRLLEALA